MALSPYALELCDRATVFDNSGTEIIPWLMLRRDGDGLLLTMRERHGARSVPGWVRDLSLQLKSNKKLLLQEAFTSSR